MSDGLSKFGIALVIIFVVSALAIFAQLFYVYWRRRVFRRRTSSAGGGAGVEASCYSSSECVIAPSKELLYFFCVRPQPHLPLNRSSLTVNSGGKEVNSNRESEAEVVNDNKDVDIDIDDLLKIQGVFGPPRFLFTIKEEMESPAPCPAENEVKETVGVDEKRGGMSLNEHFRSAEEDTAMVEIDDDDVAPFSTPCASPEYFTPLDSPVYEVVNGRSTVVV